MSNTILQVCSKPSNGNNFIDVLRAKCGISTDGKHVLNKLTNFTPLTLTAVSGHAGSVDSTGTKVKQVGDLVHLIFNISFTYILDESGDVNDIVFEALIPEASGVSKYVNGLVGLKNGSFDFLGKTEVIGNQLKLTSPILDPFTDTDDYVLRGEIFYKTDIEHKCIPCECFIKKNTYYTTKGIQIGKTLLTRFSTWTPLTLSINIGTDTTLLSQTNFSRVFGDMVHISFSVEFEYDEAPADDFIILETLPFTPALTATTYNNVGVDSANPNNIISIDTATQLKVQRIGGSQTTSTPITISGQIVYNALLY